MPRPEPLDQNKANIPSLISRAQELRHSDTLAEKLAWKLLRNRHVLHYKFRRQVANLSFKCGAQTPSKVPSTVAHMTLAVALLLLLESTQTPFTAEICSGHSNLQELVLRKYTIYLMSRKPPSVYFEPRWREGSRDFCPGRLNNCEQADECSELAVVEPSAQGRQAA